MWDVKKLQSVCYHSLLVSNQTLRKLGQKGAAEELTKKDVVTKGDVAVSKALQAYFREKGIPAILHSEEAEPVRLSENPTLLVVYDDLDGTWNYARNRDILPYCTVVSIAGNLEPAFDDFLVAGVIEHRSRATWIGSKSRGCYYNGDRCRTSGKNSLDRKTFVAIDQYMKSEIIGRLADIPQSAWVRDFGSAALHLAGIANGTFDAYLIAGNKSDELPAGYRLVDEAGGCILLWDGTPLGNERYERGKLYPIVAAATEELAREILEKIPKKVRKEVMKEYNEAKK